MPILRVLKWVAIAFTAMIVAGVLYFSYADVNWLKPGVESVVADATGYGFEIGGQFDLDIVPSPAIVLEEISIYNVEWDASSKLATIGHFSMRLNLWSLISGPLRIEKLGLRDVDLRLEKNGQNQANWDLGSRGEMESGGLPDVPAGAGVPVIVDFAALRNIQLSYRVPEMEPFIASLVSLDITIDEQRYAVLEGRGEVQSVPLQLRGSLGLTPAQVPRSLEVSVRLGEAVFELDGNIGSGTNDTSEFSVSANGPSLAVFGEGLPEIPFKTGLTASITPERLVFDRIDSSFGQSKLGGSLDVTMGNKIVVRGKLESQLLDLTPFAGDSEAPGNEEQLEAKASAKATQDKPGENYVFVEESIPFALLDKVDIAVDLGIERFSLNDIVLRDANAVVNVEDGNLHFTSRYDGIDGGKTVNDITLNRAGNSAELDMKINMRDMRVNLISGEIEDPGLIPPVGVTVEIKASGSSPRMLASSANGRVLVTAGRGRVQNNLVGKVSGDVLAQLFGALNPFAKEEEFTMHECTILAFDINNGKADIAAAYLQGEKIKIIGDGAVDLATEALNIEFNTKPRKGVGITPDMFITPFVKLKGTLASPKIATDKKGVLLAVATGGMMQVITAIFDRASGEIDRCARVIEEVGDHAPLEDPGSSSGRS